MFTFTDKAAAELKERVTRLVTGELGEITGMAEMFIGTMHVVDEYQDTNPIQEKLIERLCRYGANLCVVGDDDQTIYPWINFQSAPQAKYDTFVKWLFYQAPDYYAESDADVGCATPDVVTIATVHQAKGMQWPAVFVPALRVAPGITVDGRIDLITELDTGETSIVDFKSAERAQPEDITRNQLHIYAVGYQELTRQRADVLVVLNLDDRGKTTREMVNDSLLSEAKDKIAAAGEGLRANRLSRLQHWCGTCENCDLAGLCRTRQ